MGWRWQRRAILEVRALVQVRVRLGLKLGLLLEFSCRVDSMLGLFLVLLLGL